LTLAVCLPMAACTTLGSGPDKFSRDFIRQNLIVGKTTPEEVIKIYGQPDRNTDLEGMSSEKEDVTYIYLEKGYARSIASALSTLGFGSDEANKASEVVENNAEGNRKLQVDFRNNRLKSYRL